MTVVREIIPGSFGSALFEVWAFVLGYPFPLALVTAFAALNGLFFYPIRAPTALGRPIMDQLTGFRLYLETAEGYGPIAQAPEITGERCEALLPYAIGLGVEKPRAQTFEAALRRAYPEDTDPMRHCRPDLDHRRRFLVERRFRCAVPPAWEASPSPSRARYLCRRLAPASPAAVAEGRRG